MRDLRGVRDLGVWLVSFLDAILLGRSVAQATAFAQRRVRAGHMILVKQEQRDSANNG